MKRYSSYKDSGVEWIGEIPSGWVITRFKYETSKSVQYGINTSSDEYVDDGVRFIRTTDINEDGFLEEGGVFIPLELVGEMYLTNKFDFLISRSGTLGRTYLHLSDNKYTYGGYLVRFNFSNYPKTKFIWYFCKTKSFYDWLELNTIVSTIGNVNGQKYSNLPFPLPPLSEQTEIVSYLDEQTSSIDSLIQSKQKKITLLKEKRTSLINQIVTKGLNPNVEMKDSGVNWIGEIPSHWFCVGTNKLYHDLGTGTTPQSDSSEYYDENGYYWITTTDLNEGVMYDTLSKITDKSLVDYPNLRLYPSGSIFISMYGGRIGKLGISTFDSYCNQSVCVLPNNSSINVKFYYYWFLGFQDFVKSLGRGGGQPNINKDMIKQFPTVKLHISEQMEIVEYLDRETELIDKTVSIEERKIELLKEYKQSLISEVITGKRKVVSDE
jgi:type I restriction enzyme, S subunit